MRGKNRERTKEEESVSIDEMCDCLSYVVSKSETQFRIVTRKKIIGRFRRDTNLFNFMWFSVNMLSCNSLALSSLGRLLLGNPGPSTDFHNQPK